MPHSKTSRCVAPAAAAALAFATLSFPFSVAAQNAASPSTLAAPGAAGAPAATPALPAPLPIVNIVIKDGLQPPRPVCAHGPTVADALTEAGITLAHPDRTQPSPATPLTAGMTIVVTRVHLSLENKRQPIPFKTVFKMSRAVPAGRIQPGHGGVSGELTRTYLVGYVNNHMTARKLVKTTVTRSAQDQETLAGIRVREARALPSRAGTYQRMRCLDMTATGYSPYEGSGAGRCATGMRAGYGVVAVDPRVVRLGTKLYVEGYGYAVAGDTGGAIKGRRIDLGHTTYREAANVGRRHVRVWVLSPAR